MREEKKRILDMLSEGKLSIDEAMALLEQMEDAPDKEANVPYAAPAVRRAQEDKMLRVRIVVIEDGHKKPTNVTVNLPLKIARMAGRLMSMIPEAAQDALEDHGVDLSGIDWEGAVKALEDTGGDIINITHEDENEQVTIRVYIE